MITIYSKDNCSQCFMIQKLCERKKLDHQILKLGIDYEHENLLQLTEGKARSYPQVFNGEEYVGDFTAAQKFVAKL
jgi:glutaredoxin